MFTKAGYSGQEWFDLLHHTRYVCTPPIRKFEVICTKSIPLKSFILGYSFGRQKQNKLQHFKRKKKRKLALWAWLSGPNQQHAQVIRAKSTASFDHSAAGRYSTDGVVRRSNARRRRATRAARDAGLPASPTLCFCCRRVAARPAHVRGLRVERHTGTGELAACM